MKNNSRKEKFEIILLKKNLSMITLPTAEAQFLIQKFNIDYFRKKLINVVLFFFIGKVTKV